MAFLSSLILPRSLLECNTLLIVVLADCPFDFNTSAKVKINIIARECSPGPRNPSKNKGFELRSPKPKWFLAELTRIGAAVWRAQSLNTRPYGNP